jgi:hypothetical protein
MRNPRPEAFDPHAKPRRPDAVNLAGVVPLAAKPPLKQSVYAAPSSPTAEAPAPSVVSRHHGGMVARHPAEDWPADHAEIMKRVRKAVKVFGKEAATHRFTVAEKQALAELVYTYRGQGIRTSENEVTRIAINFLFYEYKLNGNNSILHQSLVALNE